MHEALARGWARTSCVHDIVVGVEDRASVHVDGGDPHCQLVHARLPQDHPVRVQQPVDQRAAAARLEACACPLSYESMLPHMLPLLLLCFPWCRGLR